jgi:Zn-dependent peptidase ImmA (M78 family)
MMFPFLHKSTIDSKAADLIRRVFGASLDSSSAIDLEEIVWHLSETEGLVYDDDADLPNHGGEIILGKTQPTKHRILLSSELKRDDEPGRARFTLAHELGHWVLHRPLFLAKAQELSFFGADSMDEFEFIGLQRAIFSEGGRATIPTEEWQANRFAVALLINADLLREEFGQRFGTTVVARRSENWRLQSSSLREHSRRLATGRHQGFPPLREVFELSGEAMAIALESRGYSVEEAPLI